MSTYRVTDGLHEAISALVTGRVRAISLPADAVVTQLATITVIASSR